MSRANRKNDDNGEKKINRIERIGELKKKQFEFENQRECTGSRHGKTGQTRLTRLKMTRFDPRPD